MKSQATAELSIIIVHHQTPELLKLCLKSLKKTLDLEVQPRDHLEVEPLSNHEIIVVDSTISRQARDFIEDLNTQEVDTREVEPQELFRGSTSKITTSEIKYLPFKENLGYARGVN